MTKAGEKEEGDVAKLFFLAVVAAALAACGFPELSPEPLINGRPVAVIALEGPGPFQRGALVTVDGSKSSDPENERLSYKWEQVSGSAIQFTDPAAAKTSFTAPAVGGPVVVALTVNDGVESSAQVLLEVLVTPNGKPVAIAGVDGPSTVSGGAQVVLDGSASEDPDGDELRFAWEQIAGPDVTLDDPSAAKVSFTAPQQAGTLTFGLRVSDGTETSERALVQVNVDFNAAPIAQPGAPVETRNQSSITLTGSGTDADGDGIAAFAWSVDAYPVSATYQVSGTDTAYPSFTPFGKGIYTLGLRVSDGKAWSTKASLLVTALNNPPSVVTQYPLVETSNTYETAVTGAAWDIDGDPVSAVEWAVTSLPSGALYNLLPLGNLVRFTPQGKGLYTLRYRAFDGEDWSEPGAATTVIANNVKPVASVLPTDPIPNKTTAYLSGSGTDADGDFLTYQWSVVSKPAGSSVNLQSGIASPAFKPTGKGSYWVQLVVSDGQLSSVPVSTVVQALNLAPAANAGGPYVNLTASTAFSATGAGSTDEDGDVLTYSWKVLGYVQTYGGVTPSILPPSTKGAYTLQLTVSDGVTSATAVAAVNVSNLPPSAVVTGSTVVEYGQTAYLGSTGSSDPEGTPIVGYRWTQTGGSTVAITNANGATASFVGINTLSDYTFTLEVSDGQAWSAPVAKTIKAVPSEDIAVFVSGDDGNDANPGTRAAPKKTITAGIAAAQAATPDKAVAVAAAVTGYTEAVDMVAGVHLYGGFSTAAAWSRNTDVYETAIRADAASPYTLRINTGAADPVFLDGFVIRGPAGAGGNLTTYAVKVVGSAATIRNNKVYGGGEAVRSGGGFSTAIDVDDSSALNRSVLIENNYATNGFHYLEASAISLYKCQTSTVIRGNKLEVGTDGSGTYTVTTIRGVFMRTAGTDCGPVVEKNTFFVHGSGNVTAHGTSVPWVTSNIVTFRNNLCVNDTYLPEDRNSCFHGYNNANWYDGTRANLIHNTFIGSRWTGGTHRSTAIVSSKLMTATNNYFQSWNRPIYLSYVVCCGSSNLAAYNNVFVDVEFDPNPSPTNWMYQMWADVNNPRLSSSSACSFVETSDAGDPGYFRLTEGPNSGYCIDKGTNTGTTTDIDGHARPTDHLGFGGYDNSDGSDIGWSEWRP